MTARLHSERVIGDGAAPRRWFVMTHGIYGSGGNWRSIARKIVERRPEWGAILVDLRGHGRSEIGAPPHTIAACAEDLRACLDEQARDGARVSAIAGHSFGGKVVLALRATAGRASPSASASASASASGGAAGERRAGDGALEQTRAPEPMRAPEPPRPPEPTRAREPEPPRAREPEPPRAREPEPAWALEQTWVLDSTPSVRPGMWDRPDNDVREVWQAMRELPRVWPKREAFVDAIVARGHARTLAQWLAMNLEPDEHGAMRLRLDLDQVKAMLDDYYAIDLWPAVEDPALPGETQHLIAERSDTVSAADRARLAAEPAAARAHAEVIAGAGHWLHIDAPAAVVERFARALPPA